MQLSKKEELVAVASAPYLVGLEVEAAREKLMQLYEGGIPLSHPQMLTANIPFNRACIEFCRLEERYIALRTEIQTSQQEID